MPPEYALMYIDIDKEVNRIPTAEITLIDGDAADNYPVSGNLSPSKLASDIGAEHCNLITGVELPPKEMKAWANAKMLKARLAMLRGRIRVPGFADIKLGDVIEIAGVSDRFNGRTRVSGIRHQVSPEGWQTDLQFGVSATWFSQNNNDIEAEPASGLLPVVNGLQIGIVEAYEEDPENKHRVRVRISALANQTDAKEGSVVWARLAALDAGANRGTFFRPELGDEVILGFLHDDPRQAIILGALYSEKNAPPWDIEKSNSKKGIVTKKNLKFTFDDTDDKESITLETPTGNTIILTDEGGKASIQLVGKASIQLVDGYKNKIVMDNQGISITSKKTVAIQGEQVNVE